jgi:hypothetical protein
VAQPGRALGSGPRCRWFKSSRPEMKNQFVVRGSPPEADLPKAEWFVVNAKNKIYIYWGDWGR